MSELALHAIYRANRARLESGSESWGTHVYPDVVPAHTPYPYVTQFWQGGGERNVRRQRDANIVVVVKAVSDNLAEAHAAADRISLLLNDQGEQDVTALPLDGGGYWRILTATEEDMLYVVELVDGATPVYHVGARYRYIMEAVNVGV